MAWRIVEADTQFDLILNLTELAQKRGLLFRGEASKAWKGLSPTFDRSFAKVDSDEHPLMREVVLIDDFCREAPMLLSRVEARMLRGKVLDVLMLMRHCGAPTRLLDWSKSVGVAAFAAATDMYDDDGVIWGFESGALKGARTNLAKKLVATDLRTWISELGSEDRGVVSVRPRTMNPRMVRQQSRFTVGNPLGVSHEELIGEVVEGKGDSFKLVIKADWKLAVVDWLIAMNVTGFSLYPDLLGLALGLRVSLEARTDPNLNVTLGTALRAAGAMRSVDLTHVESEEQDIDAEAEAANCAKVSHATEASVAAGGLKVS